MTKVRNIGPQRAMNMNTMQRKGLGFTLSRCCTLIYIAVCLSKLPPLLDVGVLWRRSGGGGVSGAV
ncbi:transmembrane protein, putative [Medicago truncatula]|uniref:Transmembrane protein, putative n=1 Tax=Medicago truncatula TaxID=3880 RepID=A0A072UXQ7_MEDTR|nr:transmembrane protein, putative [Medicago truncatula]